MTSAKGDSLVLSREVSNPIVGGLSMVVCQCLRVDYRGRTFVVCCACNSQRLGRFLFVDVAGAQRCSPIDIMLGGIYLRSCGGSRGNGPENVVDIACWLAMVWSDNSQISAATWVSP